MALIPLFENLDDHRRSFWLQVLQRALPEDTIKFASDIPPIDAKRCQLGIIANPAPEDFNCFTELRWCQSLWAGVDSLIYTSIPTSIHLTRLIDRTLNQRMAETVLTWCHYLQKNFFEYEIQQDLRSWQPRMYRPTEDYNVGLLGAGELAKAAGSTLLRHGFNVSFWSRTPKMTSSLPSCIQRANFVSGRQALYGWLSSQDIVVCLLPLTKETFHLINKQFIEKLQPATAILNFARGNIIDDNALIQGLDSGKLRAAVLDVFSQEPLPNCHPFWRHPKIRITPHIAAPTDIQSAAQIVAQNIAYFRKHGNAPSAVDLNRGY